MYNWISNILGKSIALTTMALLSSSHSFADQYSAQIGLKSVELLHGWRTNNGTHMAAIKIRLEDGWKTYWRAPGNNGIPPNFAWKGLTKLSTIKFHWPSPKIFNEDGVITIGYKDQLILPIEITSAANLDEIHIKTRIDFGICKDVCIPVSSVLEGRLFANQITAKASIQQAINSKPLSAKSNTAISARCKVEPTDAGMEITANINTGSQSQNIQHVAIEFPNPNIWVDEPIMRKHNDSIVAKAELTSYSDQPFILDRRKLKITLLGNKRAIEILGCPA